MKMEVHMLRGMITTCWVFFSIIWKTSAADMERSEYESTHVRMWTGWYNTDSPLTGAVDDESVTSIRKRGYEVCDGNAPIDAICRDVKSHSHMFNSETLDFIDNTLAIPCNTMGVVCRDADQYNNTCGDYQIRFECLSANKVPAPENLGVIGVAAGLSVIVPILCVAIMHMVRLMKERRNGSRQSLVENSEISVQTEGSDLPPSYSFLFGENNEDDVSGQNNTQSGLRISLTGSSGDLRLPSTRLSSSSLVSVTDNQPHSIATSQGDSMQTSSAQTSSDTQVRTSWRSRFPNMHLSVFDIFSSQSQRSEPPSPDLSYIQTPPPTYRDAIVILGGQAYNVNENGNIGEKI